MDISKFRKKPDIQTLQARLDKMSNPTYNSDDGYWKLKRDKSGNGTAIIRFLPCSPKDEGRNPEKYGFLEGEDFPVIRYFNHFFKGPNGYYIENSLTTFGEPDIASRHTSELWERGTVEGKWKPECADLKSLYDERKRSKNYVANIYIVNDTVEPENNGKVFKFRFGEKILTRLKDAMKADYEGDTVFDPFNLFYGANFKLRAQTVNKQVNYDLSEWTAINTALTEEDSKIIEIMNGTYSLLDIVDRAKNYKTAAQLESRFNTIMGSASGFKSAVLASEAAIESSDELPFDDDDDKDYFSKLLDD